ncbi:DUF4189 domain-containing protein [Nocardia sp. XZ_19_385]|uniref:DUF4189 domain-containing protein n=1 Tax=Nocardia sp. XZ_19_385 TaxID=2769488 RepID=UPI00188DE5BB|nr:DUF4189 domain-containing protein [Nocardia sp. XZ_19_385]
MILRSKWGRVAVTAVAVGLVSIGVAGPAEAGSDFWIAIAVSKSTGKVGYGWHSSLTRAEEKAESYCGVSDCKVLISDRKYCIAVARDRAGQWYTGWDRTEAGARKSAMNHGAKPTVVKGSLCH